MQGLIIQNVSNTYTVKTENKLFKCIAKGKLKKENISPVVGDKVIIEVLNDNEAIISEILPRNNYIKRPKISNITKLIFVVSTKLPKPDLLMLDKQLAFAEFNNINSVICINKIDLSNKDCEEIEEIYKTVGYKIIKTNALTREGIGILKNELKENISVFSGNSGVGKSSLINAIFNNQITKEGEISSKNKKGKNTTTITKIYEIKENSYIADTPGFSSFEIDEIKSKNLYKYFIDFKDKYLQKCEFLGCSHIKEEKCGIRQMVDKNIINENRYENYIKIYNELKNKEENKW